jgi:CheY-like chemotaxis protein
VSIPVDVIEVHTAAAGCALLIKGGIDILFVDAAISADERASLSGAVKPMPFLFVLATDDAEARALVPAPGIDGAAVKPSTPSQAKALIERCIVVRLPRRVLIVDHSATMRGIVRKILSASRFRLEIAEATEGAEAFRQIQSTRFDLVFLDYHMPGSNGVETLSQIKREFPHVEVVLMTTTPDDALAQKGRAFGAAAFLRKPFYPADIDAILHRLFGIRDGQGR